MSSSSDGTVLPPLGSQLPPDGAGRPARVAGVREFLRVVDRCCRKSLTRTADPRLGAPPGSSATATGFSRVSRWVGLGGDGVGEGFSCQADLAFVGAVFEVVSPDRGQPRSASDSGRPPRSALPWTSAKVGWRGGGSLPGMASPGGVPLPRAETLPASTRPAGPPPESSRTRARGIPAPGLGTPAPLQGVVRVPKPAGEGNVAGSGRPTARYGWVTLPELLAEEESR